MIADIQAANFITRRQSKFWFFVKNTAPEIIATNIKNPPQGFIGVMTQVIPTVHGHKAIERHSKVVAMRVNCTSSGSVLFRLMNQSKNLKPMKLAPTAAPIGEPEL